MTFQADHFYVTLPSASSSVLYGKQDPSSYRTRLNKELRLDPEEWEVGLSEISYSRTWANALDAVMKLEMFAESADPETDPPPPGNKAWSASCRLPKIQYESPQHLIQTWSTCISKIETPLNGAKVKITYDEKTLQAVIKGASTVIVHLNNPASIILGFGDVKGVMLKPQRDISHYPEKDPDMMVFYGKALRSMFPVNVNRLVDTLHVYSDAIEPQLIGDAYVPLLRAIVDRADDKGEVVSRVFTNIHYGKISRSSFSEIKIHIADDHGSQITFYTGKVTVKLHFRKRQG